MDLLKAYTACLALYALQALPVSAQWKDITPVIESTLRGNSRYSPVYLQVGSVKTIKSVNFKNTIYHRGVFSYSLAGSTSRSTYLFDCPEASYKTSDKQGGYYSDLNWITPSTDIASFDWAAYKFLCPKVKDPWYLIGGSNDGEHYHVNTETGYTFKSPVYGEVRTWVMHKRKEKELRYGGSDSSDLLQLYVACKPKSLAIYSLLSGPEDQDVVLDDQNPGSVGEYMILSACRN
jgi:hypothetical protein